MLADRRQSVARVEMERFLVEQLGLPVQVVEADGGVLLVREADVQRFLRV